MGMQASKRQFGFDSDSPGPQYRAHRSRKRLYCWEKDAAVPQMDALRAVPQGPMSCA